MKRKGRARFVEYFEGATGQLSMTRLLCFLSFWPASYCVIVAAGSDRVGELLGWYLGAFVLGYVGGKFADRAEGGVNAAESNSVSNKE